MRSFRISPSGNLGTTARAEDHASRRQRPRLNPTRSSGEHLAVFDNEADAVEWPVAHR
jgi:hypothetical protein